MKIWKLAPLKRLASDPVNVAIQQGHQKHIPIVYLIHQLGYGGAQRVILGTAKRLDRTRYCPMVVILGGRTDLQPEFEQQGIPVHNLQSRAKFDPVALLRLYKFLRAQVPCILHTHLAYTGAIGRLVGVMSGVPIIISTEQSHPNALHPLTRLVDSVSFFLADALTATSLGIEEAYWGHPKVFSKEALSQERKHFTIYSGIDVNHLQVAQQNSNPNLKRKTFQFEPTDIVIGCVGRLHPVKGQKFLIEAMRDVVCHHPQLKLLLIGDGNLAGELQAQVIASQLESKVIFAGYRDDVPELLSILDIVVVPSLYEAFGITIAEAMAVGRPVISTDTSGGRELVVHEQTGFIVPRSDSQALAGAIRRLLDNREERLKMGRRGYQRIREEFTVERMASQYSQLYDELVKRKALKSRQQ